MSRQTVVVTRVIAAPPEDVWPLLADVTGWAHWGSGLPLSSHVADVTLRRSGEAGTVLTWRVDVRPRVVGSGRAMRRRVTGQLTELAARLAARAEDPPVTRAAWASRRRTEPDRYVLVA
jgi:carbon monoxide dehydrogenase subunit G